MAQNAQLDAPFTSDAANWDSYHSPMEGNRPPVSAPPGPPTPWPPYYPPAQPARRWLPVAIIVAAIILAAALIGAVILSRGPNTAAPAAPAPTSIAGAPRRQTPLSTARLARPGNQPSPLLTPFPRCRMAGIGIRQISTRTSRIAMRRLPRRSTCSSPRFPILLQMLLRPPGVT